MKIVFEVALMVVLLACFVLQLPFAIAMSYMACALYLLYTGLNGVLSKKYLDICVLLALMLLPSVLTFNHGLTPLFYIIVTPLLIFFAYNFSRNSISHINVVLASVYWIFVFFIVAVLIKYWGEPEPLGSFIPWVSTNGIPSYLIVVQIAYSISHYLEKNRLPLFSSVITLGVAVFGLGRGSIVIGVLILCVSVLINSFVVRSKTDGQILLASFLLVSLFLLLSEDGVVLIIEVFQGLIDGSRFAAGIFDEHRARMIVDYVNKIDGLGFVLGESYMGTSIQNLYGGNPHNSFIRIHSFYGLVGLLILFAPLFFVVISRRNGVQKFVVLGLVVLALMRATSEPIFFPTPLDFFYVLYFMMFFRFSKKINKQVL